MDNLLNLINQYGLIAMFFIILVEYACFPISSEIVLPFSGAVASIQHINYFVILLLSIIAGIIGTSICYIIGRIGGNVLLEKITHKFPKTEKGITTSQIKFRKYGGLAVCFGRLIPICRTYIAFIAGAAGQNPITFLSASIIGISLWNACLIGLGYFLRENWVLAQEYYIKYKDILMPIIALVVLFTISHFRNKKLRE